MDGIVVPVMFSIAFCPPFPYTLMHFKYNHNRFIYPSKVFPIFTQGSQAGSPGTSQSTSFKWHPPRGRAKTCLYGENNNNDADLVLKPKLAIFDLDGTLIKSRFENRGQGRGQAGHRGKGTGRETQDETHWEWWHSAVQAKLRQVRDEG